jgi:hypothetical protein
MIVPRDPGFRGIFIFGTFLASCHNIRDARFRNKHSQVIHLCKNLIFFKYD